MNTNPKEIQGYLLSEFLEIPKGVGFFFMFLMSSSYQRVFEWGVKFIMAVFWRMGVGCGLRLYFVPGVLKFFCERFWEGCKV